MAGGRVRLGNSWICSGPGAGRGFGGEEPGQPAGRREEGFVCACTGPFRLPPHHSLPAGTGTAAAAAEFSRGFLPEDCLWL